MSKNLTNDVEITDAKTGTKEVASADTIPNDPPKPKAKDNTIIWLAVIVLIVAIGIFMYKNATSKDNGAKSE